MPDKIMVTLSNGSVKMIELPKYGEVKLIIRNGKVTNIQKLDDEKIC